MLLHFRANLEKGLPLEQAKTNITGLNMWLIRRHTASGVVKFIESKLMEVSAMLANKQKTQGKKLNDSHRELIAEMSRKNPEGFRDAVRTYRETLTSPSLASLVSLSLPGMTRPATPNSTHSRQTVLEVLEKNVTVEKERIMDMIEHTKKADIIRKRFGNKPDKLTVPRKTRSTLSLRSGSSQSSIITALKEKAKVSIEPSYDFSEIDRLIEQAALKGHARLDELEKLETRSVASSLCRGARVEKMSEDMKDAGL
jgi:hypothetical protein